MTISNEIKKYRNILNEAERVKASPKSKLKPTDYADPIMTPDVNFSDPTSKGELSTARKKTSVSLPGQKKSSQQTRSTRFQTPPDADMAFNSFMNQVGDVTDPVDVNIDNTPDNTPDDFGAEPVPTEPDNLPATISTDVDTLGGELDINWHEVRSLPGYAIEQIRGAFRPLFQHLTGAELEDITVATTLDPSTSMEEMQQLIGGLDHHGIKEDNFSLEAFDIDPEIYHISQAYIYDMGGQRYLG